MAQIRTLDELQGAMADDFAWRKKELHSLKSAVIANETTYNRDLYIRAAITLLYAHWEGFIRQIGTVYLQYVAIRQLNHNELSSHFLALAIKPLVHRASAATGIQACLDVVHFFRDLLTSRSNLNWRTGIETKFNLGASVFRDIVLTLGLDYSRFATREKLIDEKLLANRNSIAHGRYIVVSFEEYINLHDEVLNMMQDFYNQVDNAAFTGAHRHAQPDDHGPKPAP